MNWTGALTYYPTPQPTDPHIHFALYIQQGKASIHKYSTMICPDVDKMFPVIYRAIIELTHA